ncbi:DUF4976 domain-containing protein [candidate division KSB1 bacterium]|nr:sulfatase [candidate division KSB1 bacterium]RQW04171.1 MAG: DUF4976 domain-containing protein [candidate division KSB1 bacterium]
MSSVNRRQFLAATAASLISASFFQCAKQRKKPNVLFIAVDDLRPELGCYGHPVVKSPHIDALAAQGSMFTNTFCNVPVCGASRASLLTGIRPRRDRFVTYDTRMTEDAPDAITIPGHFKKHGYYAISLGKVAHHRDDNENHWSEPPWRPDYPAERGIQVNWRDYQTEMNRKIAARQENGAAWPYEWPEIDDNKYYDGKIADRAVQDIQRLSRADQPFFLAVGFLKPHLPFNAPKKYWDLYDSSEIRLPDNYYRPENAPDAAIHNFGELRAYYGVPAHGPVSDDMARTLIHGYYACVSFTDAQIGRVLDALQESGEADNTIVILWGDHGWNLGEHTLWCKHCNFKTSLRVPMIVKVPGKKASQSPALTEYVDIFPTLCDLAGLPKPSQLHGESYAPLLEDGDRPWKKAVFSQWHEGATVKTERYAYTEWTHDNGEVYAKMLYDHRTDPNENVNIVDREENREIVNELADLLEKNVASLLSP